MPTKVRTVVSPPGGKIGGHCVVHSANLIPENLRGEMLSKLARYNDAKTSCCKGTPMVYPDTNTSSTQGQA